MAFIDEVIIDVRGGRGGHGCTAFRRARCLPKGGPDGGDGGAGGDVVLVADERKQSLLDFRYNRRFSGENGRSGSGQERSGRQGAPCEVPVPCGTVVYDEVLGDCVGELVGVNDRLCVASGGAAGRGNVHFKSSRNRSPRFHTNGQPGETRRLRLVLKLLADVGLVGLPNAGKSSLLRAISSATPRVADYPFTTLEPQLGIVDVDAARRFTVADIPGLIEGASDGTGLGLGFLKHISRCRCLWHVVAWMSDDPSYDPVRAVQTIGEELKAYGDAVVSIPQWLVVNKLDCVPTEERAAAVQGLVDALGWSGPVFGVSATERLGLRALLEATASADDEMPEDV